MQILAEGEVPIYCQPRCPEDRFEVGMKVYNDKRGVERDFRTTHDLWEYDATEKDDKQLKSLQPSKVCMCIYYVCLRVYASVAV